MQVNLNSFGRAHLVFHDRSLVGKVTGLQEVVMHVPGEHWHVIERLDDWPHTSVSELMASLVRRTLVSKGGRSGTRHVR